MVILWVGMSVMTLAGGRQVVIDDMVFPEYETLSGFENNLWSDPLAIPFEISDEFPTDIRWSIDYALAVWEARSCLRFKNITEEVNKPTEYISFRKVTDYRCESNIGMQSGSVTVVTLGPNCYGQVVTHEIGHSLGFRHEQSRKDRDEYIEINTTSVPSNKLSNFYIHDHETEIGAYDYYSIMHYEGYAFDSIITAPVYIGQHTGISDGDAEAVDFLYNSCKATAPIPIRCVLSKAPGSDGVVHAYRNTLFNITAVGNTQKATPLTVEAFVNSKLLFTDSGVAPFPTWHTELLSEAMTYNFSFIFRTVGGEQAECSVIVLSEETAYCNGMYGDDGCGGPSRGECQNGMCRCKPPHAGISCKGYEMCRENFVIPFDSDYGRTPEYGLIGNPINAEVTHLDSHNGGGSLLSVSGRYVVVTQQDLSRPRIVSVWMKRSTKLFNIGIMFTHDPIPCGGVTIYCYNDAECETSSVTNQTVSKLMVPIHPNTWYFVELKSFFDTTPPTFEIWIDHQRVSQRVEYVPDCGITRFGMYKWIENEKVGPVWYDDLTFKCFGYLDVTGPLTDMNRSIQSRIREESNTITIELDGVADDDIVSYSVFQKRSSLLGQAIQQVFDSQKGIHQSYLQITIPSIPNYHSILDDEIEIRATLTSGEIISDSIQIKGTCGFESKLFADAIFEEDTFAYLAGEQQLYRPKRVFFKRRISAAAPVFEIQFHNGIERVTLVIDFPPSETVNLWGWGTAARGVDVLQVDSLINCEAVIDYELGMVVFSIDGIYQLSTELFSNKKDFKETDWGIYALWIPVGGAEGFEVTCEASVPTVPPAVPPTVSPTAAPTVPPTVVPTVQPTSVPTPVPTVSPTSIPTSLPTGTPTAAPTSTPTSVPTVSPTSLPTSTPTSIVVTGAPTATGTPTVLPTVAPTGSPSAVPTVQPTSEPATRSTVSPTETPITLPTSEPTAPPLQPTGVLTSVPTFVPTVTPTAVLPTTNVPILPTDSPSNSSGNITMAPQEAPSPDSAISWVVLLLIIGGVIFVVVVVVAVVGFVYFRSRKTLQTDLESALLVQECHEFEVLTDTKSEDSTVGKDSDGIAD
eukprot:TRINITY_DN14212_c0_g1_i2.p1 TRINITY_DN14212_c0_g1~~TRINITY_DN14212_c0_g1_i2.p1  ORF type:complete len:1101 (+),score=226.29 TRINITY_DN14212_c0_g1_i2:58-3303(+)